MQDLEIIKQKITSLNPPALIAVGGDEKSQQEDFAKFIRNHFLSLPNGELNHQKIDLSEQSFSNVIPSLKTMPFLCSHKLIEIINAYKLTENNINELKDYLKNPSETSLLLMHFDALDKRSKIFSFLKDLEYFCEFNALASQEYLELIINKAKKYNIILNKNTAEFLFTYLDNNLISINSALEKLFLMFKNCEIKIDDICNNISNSSSVDVFLLVRNISEGSLAKSLVDIYELRRAKESPIKFLALLMWQFRIFVHIRQCLDNGMSDWDARKATQVYGDRYEWMSKVAKKKNIDFHISRLTRLVPIDEALKSVSTKDQFVYIEKLIYQSCVGL